MKPAKHGLTAFKFLKSKNLQKASEDFRFLLDRAYPRKAALELVGNRYQLTSDQRHLLHRGVFSDMDSKGRRKKKISPNQIRGYDLVIDGHNVLITIEAGLSGRPLIFGDDGFMRDISGLSGNFRKTERTVQALQLVLKVLKRAQPRQTLFLFDSPISRSGELALEVRGRMQKENLPGDALAVRVPEKILIGFPGRVATSDTAIIDRSHKVVDLAGYVLSRQKKLKSLIRWRRKRGIVGKK
ncbi:MAG: hypothetical protein A2156_12305 [Deltaproteobacteria bacterium RBG_16_48_10]|nr:MAG: hypothetical protein A2156_12305 [Deltaproteobacteria bacterium RBG_16_48_10]